SATDFVVYWFRDETDGFSAFWAMSEDPPVGEDVLSSAEAEPLVIIEDARRPDVVYSFSFVDIDSAQAFVSDEVENGTDREQIKVYWASPVKLGRNAQGNPILTPSVPPGAEGVDEGEDATNAISSVQEENGEPLRATERWR